MKVRESGMPDQAYWESIIDHCGLIDEMDLRACASVFEFGVGYGSFLQCFRGSDTKIAGIDIDAGMVAAAQARLATLGVASSLIHGDFFDRALLGTAGPFSACLLMNILHHTEPIHLIETAARLLTPGGRIGICHWRDDIETPRGPPMAMRVGLRRAQELVVDAGLVILKSGNSARSRYHYYLVAAADGG